MRNSSKKKKEVLVAALLCVLAGFLVPFWPLAALGIVVAALFGEMVAALVCGLLLDLAYGAPTGVFSYLMFPFTLFAALCIVGWHMGIRLFFDRSGFDTL